MWARRRVVLRCADLKCTMCSQVLAVCHPSVCLEEDAWITWNQGRRTTPLDSGKFRVWKYHACLQNPKGWVVTGWKWDFLNLFFCELPLQRRLFRAVPAGLAGTCLPAYTVVHVITGGHHHPCHCLRMGLWYLRKAKIPLTATQNGRCQGGGRRRSSALLSGHLHRVEADAEVTDEQFCCNLERQ